MMTRRDALGSALSFTGLFSFAALMSAGCGDSAPSSAPVSNKPTADQEAELDRQRKATEENLKNEAKKKK